MLADPFQETGFQDWRSMEGDGALIQRLRAGDAGAINDINQRYAGELQVFCRRMVFDAALSEDIVQEVMMRCCKADAAQMPSGSLRGWLYRVARNRCIDELRKMHPQARLTAAASARTNVQPGILAIDKGTTPAGKAAKHDRAQRVQMVIDGMDDDLRDVVIMHFFQGLTNAEVAEALDLSVSGAKARLARATRLLRERLKSLDDSGI
jgi:RNA polymerase sigma-70 factor (ECF subfamily)